MKDIIYYVFFFCFFHTFVTHIYGICTYICYMYEGLTLLIAENCAVG